MTFGDPIEPSGDVAVQADIDAFVTRVGDALEHQLAEARTLAGDPA
jgi:hypothetical protein